MQWGFWVGPSQQLVLGGGFSFSTVSSAPAPGTTGLINSLMNSRWPLSPSHFFKDGWLFFFHFMLITTFCGCYSQVHGAL